MASLFLAVAVAASLILVFGLAALGIITVVRRWLGLP